jgi:hypothetical protein
VAWFYNSFRPILNTARGRAAVEEFGLPPFIDGSCRREPDFEAEFPAITGLCRKGKFAPRLKVGDTAIYVTTKGAWSRRLVAVLRVLERFDGHDEAAAWYRERGLPLPSNCWVDENPPIPYDRTVQDSPEWSWDMYYKRRSRNYPVFLATDPLFCELRDPPTVTDEMLIEAFGRIPGTQNPPEVPESQGRRLLALAGVELRAD